METRNGNGDVLSNEVFEEKKEITEAFEKAMDNVEVKTIKITKDIPMTEERRRTVEKKLRRTLLKAAELEREIKEG